MTVKPQGLEEKVKNMLEDLQGGFSSARVDVGGRSPVVIYKVRDAIYSEPHLPALWKWLLIQQPKNVDHINVHRWTIPGELIRYAKHMYAIYIL